MEEISIIIKFLKMESRGLCYSNVYLLILVFVERELMF